MKRIRRSSLTSCVVGMVLFVSSALLPIPARCNGEKPRKLRPRTLTKEILSEPREIRYGDFSVAKNDTITGSIAVVEGSLDMSAGSVVEGEVWVVNGDLILGSDARADGEIHLVNGELFQSKEATLTGPIHRYRCECRLNTDLYESTQRVIFIKETDPEALRPRLAAGHGSINRAEFSSLRLGVQRGNPDNLRPHWKGRAQVILPFRDNARGYLGFDGEISIPISGRVTELTISGFKKTVTNDAWGYSTAENSAALLLTHNDFHDYYERTGVAASLTNRLTSAVRLQGGVYLDHSRSLITRTVPSLANNGRPLRDNPGIDEGRILGGTASATLDTRIVPSDPASAWYGHAAVEAGLDAGPGEYGFATVLLDVRRYNRLWEGINVDVRGRIFTAFTDIPRQRYQSLNGYGGVRGLHDIPFDVRRGNRLALASAEVRVPMPEAPVLKYLYTTWHVVAFGDLGLLALDEDPDRPFAFLTQNSLAWGKSVGIGISGESFLPYLGFYVAQDVAEGFGNHNKRPRFIIRAERSF